MVPFGVVGADPALFPQKGRSYPWGFVDAEDESVSDLVHLRYALLSSHLQDMRDKTEDVLYEQYRTEILSGK